MKKKYIDTVKCKEIVLYKVTVTKKRKGFVQGAFRVSLFVCLSVCAFTRESGWFTNTLRNGTVVVH
jgi:hypothetical protein